MSWSPRACNRGKRKGIRQHSHPSGCLRVHIFSWTLRENASVEGFRCEQSFPRPWTCEAMQLGKIGQDKESEKTWLQGCCKVSMKAGFPREAMQLQNHARLFQTCMFPRLFARVCFRRTESSPAVAGIVPTATECLHTRKLSQYVGNCHQNVITR